MCKVLTVALVLVVDLPCSFPMGFLSDRLYAAIARKAFVDTHNPRSMLYAVSKVVKTPIATAWAAEHYPGKSVSLLTWHSGTQAAPCCRRDS
jgi:hypothetical protein